MAQFLDEVNGDFVLHTKSSTAIETIVGGRIYPEAAPQGIKEPHLIYTQASGHAIKSHQGRSGVSDPVLHVYCIASSQPQANQLASLVEAHWLDTEGPVGNGTYVQVCNGGQYDRGQWFAIDSSDLKQFYVRLVLRMLVNI